MATTLARSEKVFRGPRGMPTSAPFRMNNCPVVLSVHQPMYRMIVDGLLTKPDKRGGKIHPTSMSEEVPVRKHCLVGVSFCLAKSSGSSSYPPGG